MVLVILLIVVIQTRSLSGMVMVALTAPLGLIGTVPALLLFGQPSGLNAILGLIGLAGTINSGRPRHSGDHRAHRLPSQPAGCHRGGAAACRALGGGW
jgi:hypothetical protein